MTNKKIEYIICDGCGNVRRWIGFNCLDICPCEDIRTPTEDDQID